MEQVHRDLRGGDGELFHHDGHVVNGVVGIIRVGYHRDRRAAHGEPRIGKHRQVVATGRDIQHGLCISVSIAVQRLASRISLFLGQRMVAGVEVPAKPLVDGRRNIWIHRVGVVFLQYPAETIDRITVSVHHTHIELSALDGRCRRHDE